MSTEQETWPYRLALAGGWIDQPYVNRHMTVRDGSMVTVCIEPNHPFNIRSGMGSSTRALAMRKWPNGPSSIKHRLDDAIEELYYAENALRAEYDRSGSQDAAGLVYPGFCELAYAPDGIFPTLRRQMLSPEIAEWFEGVVQLIVIGSREKGYHPQSKGLHLNSPIFVNALGYVGTQCFDAIKDRDGVALGKAMYDCSVLWKALMPAIFDGPKGIDLWELVESYRDRNNVMGCMLSGCGGGYLIVVSHDHFPEALRIKVRL